jgi:hypothetical protein
MISLKMRRERERSVLESADFILHALFNGIMHTPKP